MARLYARLFRFADAAMLHTDDAMHQAIDAGIKEDEAWKLLRQILQAVRLSVCLAATNLKFSPDRFFYFPRDRAS